jgi:hypothetical protein
MNNFLTTPAEPLKQQTIIAPPNFFDQEVNAFLASKPMNIVAVNYSLDGFPAGPAPQSIATPGQQQMARGIVMVAHILYTEVAEPKQAQLFEGE